MYIHFLCVSRVCVSLAWLDLPPRLCAVVGGVSKVCGRGKGSSRARLSLCKKWPCSQAYPPALDTKIEYNGPVRGGLANREDPAIITSTFSF